MTLLLRRALVAALSALSLSACINSAAPILTDAQPLLGTTLPLQVFSLRKGEAYDPEQARYVWNGTYYAHAGGSMADVRGFSLHAFEGNDFIVQTVPGERDHGVEYAVLRRLTDGVFLVVPVDEDDADAQTRAQFCQRAERSPCRIKTREQLLAFARATAARPMDRTALVIRLADDTEKTPEK